MWQAGEVTGAAAELLSEPTWLLSLTDDEALSDDATLAAALVRRGVAIGREVRARPLRATRKTSVSDIVTEADHRAEAEIVAALTRLRPDDAILGEEGASRAGSSGRTWIIDPIDGTYNFASGIGAWCSAIALRDTDGGLLGAVRAGETGQSWVGRLAADGSRSLQVDGTRAPDLPDRGLAEIALTTYLHPARMSDPDVLQPWLAASSGAATVRMRGSGSLDLAAVATGSSGGFLQGGTADWDWYPGLALVTAAGGVGRVLTHRGQRWHMAGSPRVVAELSERLVGA